MKPLALKTQHLEGHDITPFPCTKKRVDTHENNIREILVQETKKNV